MLLAQHKESTASLEHPHQENAPKRVAHLQGMCPVADRDRSGLKIQFNRQEEQLKKLPSQQFLIQMDQSGIPSSSLCITLTRNCLLASPRQQEGRHIEKIRSPNKAGGRGVLFVGGSSDPEFFGSFSYK